MSDHLTSQCTALVRGINAFEPFIDQLHRDYREDQFVDWPTVILATSLQATAVSTFKLLPPKSASTEILDKRSIATMVRNVVDTHDVMEMLINPSSAEELNLHRNILGLYLSGRIKKIRSSVAPGSGGDFYSHTKAWYWKRIQASELYKNSMKKLKDGEQIFYQSRAERVKKACGENATFVLGILADLSTFVHSVPPAHWGDGIDNLYSNDTDNRNFVAVWLRLANFYFARSTRMVLKITGFSPSPELEWVMAHHESVFN